MMELNMRCEVIEAICAQLKQDNDRTRWSAVKSLSRIGAREAIPALIAHLDGELDPDVRMEIADAFGKLGAQEAVNALIFTLHEDPDEDVRIQACRALGQLPSPRAMEALIDCLTGHAFVGGTPWEVDDEIDFGAAWELQREALEGLGNIGDAHAVDAIVQFMASDERDDLEALGLRVLGTLGGERALGFVLRQLQEGSPLTRCRAARVLGTVDASTSRQPLIEALKDREPEVRLAAGWALVAEDDEAAVPHLDLLLRDANADVRLEALSMIATSSADGVPESLMRHLDDSHRKVQLRVIQILEDRCEQRAIAPMLLLLTGTRTDPILTAALIRALGVLRARDALAPVCQLLEDGSTSSIVRLQAALALGDIAPFQSQNSDVDGDASQEVSAVGQPDPIKHLIALVDDVDSQVCQAAQLSLAKLGWTSDGAGERLEDEGEETAHEAILSDQDDETVSADYPTSTLEAIDRARRIASSQAAASRQLDVRQDVSMPVADAGWDDLNHEASEPLDSAIANLHDDDRNVQRAALANLAHLQDRSAIEALRDLLFAHGGELWPETLSTLLELNDTELLSRLLSVLEQPEQDESHWIAVEAMAEVLFQQTEMV